jgi:mannose-6-phosphate isomerase-like protein (cupin superfamily)
MCTVSSAAAAGGQGRGGSGGGRGQMEVLVPMPVKANPFVAPNKPLTKLPDLLAKHKGQQNWKEIVVHDHLFHAEYIQMAAGAKTPRMFQQDHRTWWVVQDGQIRFTIEGQEPFVASKGFLVQVPKRLIYQHETVSHRPALAFEVTKPAAQTT